MNTKINAKRLSLLAIANIILIIAIAKISGVENYYDFFTGAFVGVVVVLSLFWIIVIIKSMRSK